MNIQESTGGVIVIRLPCNPALGDDLHSATRLARDRGVCHIVLDFSDVEFLDSSHLSSLLRLHQLVQQHNGRLILCGLGSEAGHVLAKAGLDGMFEIKLNRSDALAAIQACHQPPRG